MIKKLRRISRRYYKLAYGLSWSLRAGHYDKELLLESKRYLNEHQENLVFITGSGRSGTQLISSLLGQLDSSSVWHEPNFAEDVSTMNIMRNNHNNCIDYWKRFRSVEICKRWRLSNTRIYGEVNGTIRYQVPAIKELYPNANLFLMVRDGREVIRSIMKWKQFYSRYSIGAYNIKPLKGDPYFDVWKNFTKFEKLCWSWQDTYKKLTSIIPQSHWLKLENITRDPNYFQAQCLDHLGESITHGQWNSIISKKSFNSSTSYSFSHYTEWDKFHTEAFWKICGDMMETFGYHR